MSACHPLLSRRVLRAALPALLLGLSGCAGTAMKTPAAPDESALAPARQALAEARDAHADDFAPRDIDAARRRITTARDILFTAARADRPLTAEEHDRIAQLVSAARLDARAALTQTQAQAVGVKIAQLQAQLHPQAESPSSPQTPGSPTRPSPLNPQPQASQRSILDRQPGNDRRPPPGPRAAPPAESPGGLGPPGPTGRAGQPVGANPMGMP